MKIQKEKIFFIGAGNMGEALLKGIVNNRRIPRKNLFIFDADAKKLQQIVRRYNVAAKRTADGIREADIIIVAVKPQQMETLISCIKGYLDKKKLLISVAAGVPTAWFEKKIGLKIPVIRTMPNTPALVGQGAIAIARGTYASLQDEKKAKKLLCALGYIVPVPEKCMNSVTALSGSGPAYVFYLAEAMIAAGIAGGLNKKIAAQLVEQTIIGAGALWLESGQKPEILRRKVTSPGGTTEAAIAYLEKKQVKKHIVRAIAAARHRSHEISQKISN